MPSEEDMVQLVFVSIKADTSTLRSGTSMSFFQVDAMLLDTSLILRTLVPFVAAQIRRCGEGLSSETMWQDHREEQQALGHVSCVKWHVMSSRRAFLSKCMLRP